MLKGFNYPLTPKGKSTLNPPPPWYYSSDFLNIEFWSEPCPPGSTLIARRMATPVLISTIGNSPETTTSILTQPVISIASFSYWWMRYSKANRSRIVRIFS
jgi:hypothetical protein